MPFDGEKFRAERDRDLRRALLEALEMNRAAPMKGLNGLSLVKFVSSGLVNDLSFNDDDHALNLIRDLVNKQLVEERLLQLLRHERFSPRHLFLKITDKGSQLLRRQIPADPDVADERVSEET